MLAVVISGLAACKDKSLTSYRTPKEPETDLAPTSDAMTPAAAPTIRWAVPAGWQPQAAGGLRLASFLVPGANGASAEVSIVSFPGSGGDELANINRWRAQLQLAPIAETELPGQEVALTTGAGQFVTADMAGVAADKGPTRILGAWLRQAERVWFVKMMGPPDLVGTQKDVFVAFLQSVRMAEGSVAALPAPADSSGANTNDLPRASGELTPPLSPPVGNPPMDSVAVPAEGGANLLWQAPADWQAQAGRPMRKASYATGSGAEVAITAFPGDVGGILANVNRWRGQAGLGPIDDAGLAQATTAVESQGLRLIVVDVEGGSAPLVAALVPWNGATWFFKLTGSAGAVAQAKPAFLAFLKTIRAP